MSGVFGWTRNGDPLNDALVFYPIISAILGRQLLKDSFRKRGAVVMNDSVAQRAYDWFLGNEIQISLSDF